MFTKLSLNFHRTLQTVRWIGASVITLCVANNAISAPLISPSLISPKGEPAGLMGYSSLATKFIPFANEADLDLLYGYDTTLEQGSAPCVVSSEKLPQPDTRFGSTPATLHYISDATTYVERHQTSAAAAYEQGVFKAEL